MALAIKSIRDLATVTFCIHLSLRIVTKSSNLGPQDLYLYSPSLWNEPRRLRRLLKEQSPFSNYRDFGV
jgi:hypothetical protein